MSLRRVFHWRWQLVKPLMIASSLALMSCASHAGKSGSQYPVGDIKAEQLLGQFDKFTLPSNYSISEQEQALVKAWPTELQIDVYFGAWCHDSQREVPRLLKALNGNSNIAINLIALDIKKQEPQGRATQLGVKYTPTFVVSLAGHEIGRIVERPNNSLVGDIDSFIKANKSE
ncbi:thioredoxin family protein [Endozoicomonas sp. G2_1]|uniref:thioredoxin family protein n=1 Tax=Endozoicomonas sp. G2_1 TaxID=2821091 RepID=UPI001FFE0C71|nr:thioredoxin family protein [Endozoicomonas sp. G2_1]